jgi:hypothetical protein
MKKTRNVLVLNMILNDYSACSTLHFAVCGSPASALPAKLQIPSVPAPTLSGYRRAALEPARKREPMVLEGYRSMDSSLYLMIFVDVHPRINMYNICYPPLYINTHR